jgi:hypothetical protein
MDLSGAAFAPAFVPYTTACEVWRTNPAFVPPPASAPEMDAAENMVAPAPSVTPESASAPTSIPASAPKHTGPMSDFSPFDGKYSNVDTNIPTVKVKLNTPGDEKLIYGTPDPVKLVPAVPRDWRGTDLKADVKGWVESKLYWGMLKDRTKWMNDDKTVQYRGGGTRDSHFEFAYSEQDKAITCTLRVMLTPMDLYPVDLKGARDTTVPANQASVPYETTAHKSMTPGMVKNGVKMDYRDAVGDKYDVPALKSRIESVLNQGGYKLILDGCSKGAACGCRVKIIFKVDLRVSVKGAAIDGFRPHVSLHLFSSVLRADTSAWGEQQKSIGQDRKIHDYPAAHAEAHECGHYFNFPDEYFDQGGWLHESYINDDEQVDFSRIDAKAGAQFWQGHSTGNLMGDGANLPVSKGGARISPYYLEYVRRQFSLVTNKLWRVGYES